MHRFHKYFQCIIGQMRTTCDNSSIVELFPRKGGLMKSNSLGFLDTGGDASAVTACSSKTLLLNELSGIADEDVAVSEMSLD